MSNAVVTKAIVTVVERIRADDSVDLEESVLASIDDLQHYVQQAFDAKLRRDTKSVKKNLMDAQMTSSVMQLTIPGLEHAALPAMLPDPSAERPTMVSTRNLPYSAVVAGIKEMRRDVNIRERIVGGYEATISRIAEIVDPEDDTPFAEIEGQLRALDA